jgi:hypothetical protein
MTRAEYHNARRTIRDNGRYALCWMPADQARVMDAVTTAPKDPIAERADCYAAMGWSVNLAKSIARGNGAERFARKAYSIAEAVAKFEGGAA